MHFEIIADGVTVSIKNTSTDQPCKIALYGIVSNTPVGSKEGIGIGNDSRSESDESGDDCDCILFLLKHCNSWQDSSLNFVNKNTKNVLKQKIAKVK